MRRADRGRQKGLSMKTILTLAVAAAAVVAVPANAVTFDLFNSFNGTTNPAGQFTFGYVDPALTTFTPFATTGFSTCQPGLSCLLTSVEPALGAYKNTTGAPLVAFSTVSVPANALFLHPGPTLLSAVSFTAPVAGNYNFTFFSQLLSNSTITGTELFSGFANGSVITSAGGGTFLTQQNPSFASAGQLFLGAGQSVFVAVGPDGDYSFDSTQIAFALSTSVPEPASWAMLIAGFGLTGAVLRRRRAVALAA
jgi:hypothetical protein